MLKLRLMSEKAVANRKLCEPSSQTALRRERPTLCDWTHTTASAAFNTYNPPESNNNNKGELEGTKEDTVNERGCWQGEAIRVVEVSEVAVRTEKKGVGALGV